MIYAYTGVSEMEGWRYLYMAIVGLSGISLFLPVAVDMIRRGITLPPGYYFRLWRGL